MKFYVIEKQYKVEEMLEMFGYATSIDVIRWFMIVYNSKDLVIMEYECSEIEFIQKFDDICDHEVTSYKLEMRQSLDGKMCAPIYVNQDSSFVDDYCIPTEMGNLKATIEKISNIIGCMKESFRDNMIPIVSLLNEYLQKYNHDNTIGSHIMDRDTLIIKYIYEGEDHYYGDY